VSALPEALVDAAATPYRAAGRFAFHTARGKLRHDPVFAGILSRGFLTERRRILDLGCGQGLLTAVLMAAQAAFADGAWPRDWPAPPTPVWIRGIERRARAVRVARRAVSGGEFVAADLADAELPRADAIVLIDVLHYLDYSTQVTLLRRVAGALEDGGVLLLRVGDAASRWPHALTHGIDFVVACVRGPGLPRLYGRALGAWRELLNDLGFDSEPLPMSEGVPFANVLMVARQRRRP
jgi:SAM-dependent methyltransferase